MFASLGILFAAMNPANLGQLLAMIEMTPGMMLGRLTAEPWLALVGVAIGVALSRPWRALAFGLVVGALWGLASAGMAGEPVAFTWLYTPAVTIGLFTFIPAVVRDLFNRNESAAE